jgi:transcriptional regulator with GAF, ATPase, and Fis domain
MAGRPPVEDAEDRLRAIASITDSRIDYLDVDDLLDELLARVVVLLDADTAAVLLLDATGQQLEARAACGIEEEVRQGVRVPVGMGFAGRIAAERRPVTLDRVDPTTVWNPILWQKGIRKILGVPLQRGPELLGVLHVGRLADIDFTPRGRRGPGVGRGSDRQRGPGASSRDRTGRGTTRAAQSVANHAAGNFRR